jgi:Ca2+-binding RTX toxin-like protein
MQLYEDVRKIMSITSIRETALIQGEPVFAIRNGTSGADTLNGTSAADTISGLGGADLLYGKGGNDKISGGGGNDFLFGGAGNDTLDGGAGNDVFIGAGGADDFIIRKNQGEDTIDAFQDGLDEIRFIAQGGDTVKFMVHYNTSIDLATVTVKVNGVISNTILVENVELNDLQQSQQGNTLILS